MGKEVTIHESPSYRRADNAVSGSIRARENSVERKIHSVYNDIRRNGYSTATPFSVGHIEKRMRDFADNNNITIGSNDMYMSVKSLTHARRASKVRDGKALSEKTIARFPSNRSKMHLYYDGDAFVYTNFRSKFIVHPNYELRMSDGKVRKVAFVTAGKANKEEFSLPKYIKV